MTAIVTSTLRIKNARLMKDLFTDPANSLYLFVSKPTEWDDEAIPIAPTDSHTFEKMARDEMMTLRKIASLEVTQSFFRINWESGRYYDMFRNDYDNVKLNGVDLTTGAATTRNGLSNANFYVVNSDFNVYKCISNNGGVASTVEPTGTSTNIFMTADGYRWKYMLTINSADVLRFESANFLPVQSFRASPGSSSPYYNQYLTQSTAIPGTIDVIEIESAGTGYATSSTLPIEIIGDGTGATATATTDVLGRIESINITNVGTGYTYAIARPTGTNVSPAILTPIVSPKNGHGYDPVDELFGYYVTVSASIGDDLSEDTLKENEYRIIGLILNPKVYGSQAILTSQTANALRAVSVAGGVSGTFVDDEGLLSEGSTKGTFVSYSPSSKLLKYVRNPANGGADFSVSQSITGVTSSATGIITAVQNPEVDTNSGDIIYIETRRPIYRSISQKEEMRITIET